MLYDNSRFAWIPKNTVKPVMATPYRILLTTSGLRRIPILLSNNMTIALTPTHRQESRSTWNLSSKYVWKISNHWPGEPLRLSKFLSWNGNLLYQKSKAQDMHHFGYGLLERPGSHRFHFTITKIQFKKPPLFSEQVLFWIAHFIILHCSAIL
jgi:hypothetical protein